MTLHRRTVLQSLAASTLGGALPAARAQAAWPKARPLTLIVPFSAGGSLDATARVVGQHLGERLGQTVVIENITGAGGALGFQRALAAAPDGYTFLIAGDAPLVPGQETSPQPYKHDVRKELVPVVLVNTAPMVLVAHPSLKAASFAELVALARANPGKFNYGSPGVGTIPHLCMEQIKRVAKLHMVHIPYRGGAQIANDVAGNVLDLAMMISSSAFTPIQSKTVKPLAVTSARRLNFLPDVPAVAETPGVPGFKGFNVESWAGIYAPAGTPAAIVQHLNAEVSAVLKLDVVTKRLGDAGLVLHGGPPSDFVAYIDRDRAQTIDMLRNTRLS